MSENPDSGIPEDLRYSEQHEWVFLDGDVGTIGITDYAQAELGDIVFVELPEVGERLESGQTFGSVEAVKAVEDLYCPVAGEVLEVNDTLEDGADQVNGEPYGAGWMIKLRLDNPTDADDLMSAADYSKLVEDA